MADEAGLPLPSIAGRVTAPVAMAMGRQVGLDRPAGAGDAGLLPALLDRIEQLIDQDVIGDLKNPNAADFQIVTSLRVLLTHEDIARADLGAATRRSGRWS